MKWLTGQVRCQVTGRNPTLNGRLAASAGRNRPRFSPPWSRLIATSQVPAPRRVAFFSVMGPNISQCDTLFKETGGGAGEAYCRAMDPDLSLADHRALAQFRHLLRRFLKFSQKAAGLPPQQHQLLLSIKGLPEGRRPTITELARYGCR